MPRQVRQLPPCDGPKLSIFPHHASPIQWHERLGENETLEGFVFCATIQGRRYAVKVFKFYNPMSSEYFWGPLLGESTPIDTAAYYTDPFYAECRAYGRIHEAVQKKKMRNDIATMSHGFLFLRKKDHEYLKRYHNIDLGFNKVDKKYQQSTVGGCKPRAIVKDLAVSDPGVIGRGLRKTLNDVMALNNLGIYNMDIRLDNYRGGQVVDFGCSWTEPHRLLDALDKRSAEESRLSDRAMFDEMVRDEEIPNPKGVKAMHSMKLRPHSA